MLAESKHRRASKSRRGMGVAPQATNQYAMTPPPSPQESTWPV